MQPTSQLLALRFTKRDERETPSLCILRSAELLVAEPDRGEDPEHNEDRQNNKLRHRKRRLRLGRSQRCKDRHLHEKLCDQDESIQVQRNHGGNYVDTAPRAGKLTCVARVEGHRQNE
jgi:hypothetical protein